MRGAHVAWAVLAFAACHGPPAVKVDARKAAAVRGLQAAFWRSVENEKLAVLAVDDDDSARFAAASRAAAVEVDRLRGELRSLIADDERASLNAFDAAWARMAKLDAQLLTLATENANLKASALSAHRAAAALDEVEAAFTSVEEATDDPQRLRALSRAAVAAARVQTLHAPHIAAATSEEKAAIEIQVRALEAQVSAVVPASAPAKAREAPLDALAAAWAAYQAVTDEVLTLSKSNSNRRSLDLSLNEKVEATRACDASLGALTAQLHAVPHATR